MKNCKICISFMNESIGSGVGFSAVVLKIPMTNMPDRYLRNYLPFPLFFKKVFREYSWLTDLCQLQVYSTVNQLHVYMYPVFFRFISHRGYYVALSSCPVLHPRSLPASYFIYVVVCVCQSHPLIYPSPTQPFSPNKKHPNWFQNLLVGRIQ